MRKWMFLLVGATALVVSAVSTSSVTAAPADGAAIAKAASTNPLVQDAYWVRRGWGYRYPVRRYGYVRGWCPQRMFMFW
jgi:hypothetical protein